MTILEAVREYIGEYPGLTGGKLNVDFLPAEAASYSVNSVPAAAVVRQYLDGGSVRQFLFVLASRTYYGEHIRQQLDNIAFFERFSNWLDMRSAAGDFPDIGKNRVVRTFEVTTSGYAFAPDANTARYQIQCKLTYFQGGKP